MTYGRLPKIVPGTIPRSGVESWLDVHAAKPLRYVSAPAGSGKTTCAVLYARTRNNPVIFVTLPPRTDVPGLLGLLALKIGAGPADTYDALLRAIETLPRSEIVVDNVDYATAEARAVLTRLYRDVPDEVTFIYLARSEDAIRTGVAQAQGLAEVCDPAIFAFSTLEIAAFAASLGMHEDPFSITRLYEATHGWALAVAGACRAAAIQGTHTYEALPAWEIANRDALNELLEDAMQSVPADVVQAFMTYVGGRIGGARQALESFKRYGLFASERERRLCLNPVMRHAAASAAASAENLTHPAEIEMFGHFSMTVGGRAVAWERRRDRQIIQFLATQPHGQASRADLIAAFWPDADRQLAGQSVRTACSTIRRAIGVCVGLENVPRYFVADHTVELKLDSVLVSSRQFERQFERAEDAFARNDGTAAFTAYREAQLLYRAPFLAGEAPMPWSALYEARFERMYDVVLARLVTLSKAAKIEEARRTQDRAEHERSA